LAIQDEIIINIIDSFAEPDLCCRPNRGEDPIVFPSETPNPSPSVSPTPSVSITTTPNEIYTRYKTKN